MGVSPGQPLGGADFWYDAIRAGIAFMQNFVLSAQVGNFAKAQLANPSGSGKTVLLASAMLSCSTSSEMQMYTYGTPFPTDGGAGINCLVGAAAGLAHIYSLNDPTAPGTKAVSILTVANTPVYFNGRWFVQIPAGQGIYFVTNSNISLDGTLWWVEL